MPIEVSQRRRSRRQGTHRQTLRHVPTRQRSGPPLSLDGRPQCRALQSRRACPLRARRRQTSRPQSHRHRPRHAQTLAPGIRDLEDQETFDKTLLPLGHAGPRAGDRETACLHRPCDKTKPWASSVRQSRRKVVTAACDDSSSTKPSRPARLSTSPTSSGNCRSRACSIIWGCRGVCAARGRSGAAPVRSTAPTPAAAPSASISTTTSFSVSTRRCQRRATSSTCGPRCISTICVTPPWIWCARLASNCASQATEKRHG